MIIYHSEVAWNTNEWRTTIPGCTVIEPEPITRFSGLLDASGNKLMVTVKSEPAGFVIFCDPISDMAAVSNPWVDGGAAAHAIRGQD